MTRVFIGTLNVCKRCYSGDQERGGAAVSEKEALPEFCLGKQVRRTWC